jgi:ligand-binding SRPBCC domain-containing protein
MKTHLFVSEQFVTHPVERVFPFFADPRNLEAITPPWLHFQITGPEDLEMRRGLFIDYRLRLHGFPFGWRTEITEWEPFCRFVDEQRRGPYRKWRHEHLFVSKPGGTLIRDKVEYAVPGGVLVHCFVRRDVSRIFAFRQAKLSEIFPNI